MSKLLLSNDAQTRGVTVAQQVFQEFLKQRQELGSDQFKVFSMFFISSIISGVFSHVLRERPDFPMMYTQEELYQLSKQTFVDMKAALQNAVAAGVQGGLQSYAGDSEEYYCMIKPVPEVRTKRVS